MNAIGFNSPSACFCQNVIPRPVLLASVVTMLSLSFAYCANAGLRLAFLLIVSKSFCCSVSLYFSSKVFVVCRFFLTVSVRILPNIVLPRETVLVVSGFPDVSNAVWLYICVSSVLSRLHLFVSKPFHFVLKEFVFLLICSINGIFQFRQYIEQFLFVIFSVSPCYYYNIV